MGNDADWASRNFARCSYVDPKNNQTLRCFKMTLEGFTMLAMGFTGPEAFKFKLAYIRAFEDMRTALVAHQGHRVPTQSLS
jgi:Rha family phage regulatory protein